MKYTNLKKLEINKVYIFAFEDNDKIYPIRAKVERDDEYPSKRNLVNPNDEFNIFSLLYFVKDKNNLNLLVFDNIEEAKTWCK